MNDLDKIETLYKSSKNLLNFAETNIKKRVLFTSSGAIYGGMDLGYKKLIDENCRLAPLSTTNNIGLALGKRVAEYLFFYSQNRNVNMSIARCFSFVGPGLPFNLHYAIGNFVRDAIMKNSIIINGDGSPVRSYMYLGDMVVWLLTILLEGKNGKDYNVGSEKKVSILRLANLIQKKLNSSGKVVLKNKIVHSTGTPPNYFNIPDTTRCKNELNLSEINLEDSILNYGKYLKQII